MKHKKKIYNAITILIFIIVLLIPFLDWNKKNNIQSRFNEVERKIFQDFPDQMDRAAILFALCDTINQFISENPLDLNALNCSKYKVCDSTEIISCRTNLIKQMQSIDDTYRKQARIANHRLFIILIISQIFLWFARRQIDNRIKE